MKPNPFSALNHFTVPCGIFRSFLLFWVRYTVFPVPGPAVTAIPRGVARNFTRPTPSQEPRPQREILRKFDTNTEAAAAISQSRSRLERQLVVLNSPNQLVNNAVDGQGEEAHVTFGSELLRAAELAHAGRHVVVSTGTASGKSLAYQLPILNTLAADPRARALYLSPTKALGHDQLRTAHALTAATPLLADVAPTAYDGDSPAEVRRFARERSRWLFSNPDMVHLSMLRNHARWAVFLRNLRYLVVDECHYYRGVFGSNVAMVLRRLLRLCARYSGAPTVIFASATTASPGATAAELIGQPVAEITEDSSPQGGRTVALWEPPLRDDLTGENGAPVRRSAAPRRRG